MKSKLDYIERQLKKLFEGSDRVFPWGEDRQTLIRKLIETLHNSITEDDDGNLTAPSVYTVYIPSEDITSWQINDETVKMLSLTLQDAASEVGVQFRTKPTICFEINSSSTQDELHIGTSELPEHGEKTTFIETKNPEQNGDQNFYPQNAFLIINDNQNFPLDQPVISIGRKKDNQLVLDNPHISRVHAQIRVSQNHYVLFDLDATGGTFVNGQRIKKHILQPGDVISLAGIPIIYGEETPLYEDTPVETHLEHTTKTGDFPEENNS
jgi:hypothetical protein